MKRIFYKVNKFFPEIPELDANGEPLVALVATPENTGLPFNIHIIREDHVEKFKRDVSRLGGDPVEATPEAMREVAETIMEEGIKSLMYCLLAGVYVEEEEAKT